ncbi:hypothetical protein [Pseudomonas sp. lyk4-TYG-107]|uniref:hypothetical protein n=1 Tax=Pseudomonas sp. lyk4-TYG-107 TaxID=3040317 RepID=UPI002555BBBC|nr:hypothetical protein [Pseudomonas sp. lyk4-TYG-107]
MLSFSIARLYYLLPLVFFCAPAAYSVEPSKPADTLLVPSGGVKTTIVANQPALKCLDSTDCSAVLVIDVKKFPESVKGLEIETRSKEDGVSVSEKHFKDHDGSGSFLVPLDKSNLKRGYDFKITPIPRSKDNTAVENLTIDKIGLEILQSHPLEK